MCRPQPTSGHQSGGSAEWRATGLEKPVFLDESGRRGRLVRLTGALAALLVATWLGLVVAGPVGFANLPAAVLPTLGHHARATNVVYRPSRRHEGRARALNRGSAPTAPTSSPSPAEHS